ncbi:PadR family transcriptional regulator [Cellulomonas bogoriensis]|uniref:PadR family transcriptional regulator n=1 Tax=Cellulomonas bogoriensis 69B4 = DSM 16987 TaxID=1386082 RepID=A0A0A0C158_9CELL|nr:PadR family transcriptional regulator [Cellulomonas bogoriensis]KGM13677.1 PadR family transcriptional regulator [Cellulomonas bogoriensis 69B4 = DSM 16987]
MSVRHGIVALLAEKPMHGYQLKVEFERRTGATWPLNIGQVYTTLGRLTRDGLVEPLPDPPDPSEPDDPGVKVERFTLTARGRDEAAAWWARPVERGAPARDELAIKIALAVTAPGVDVAAVIQAQRTETLRCLHDYTRLSAGASAPGAVADARPDLAWALVLDSLIFAAEAEVRWLDHVEARIARLGPASRARTSGADPGAGARHAGRPHGTRR